MTKSFNYAAATNFIKSDEFVGVMAQVRKIVERDPRANQVCDHMAHCAIFTPIFLLEGAEERLESLRKAEKTLEVLRNWKEGDAPVPLTFWYREETRRWADLVDYKDKGELVLYPTGCNEELVRRSIQEVEEMAIFDRKHLLWRLEELSINYC